MKKRLIALALSVLMCIQACPLSASAENLSPTPVSEESKVISDVGNITQDHLMDDAVVLDDSGNAAPTSASSSDSLSYTVDFNYNGVEFSIPGGTEILISDLFLHLQIDRAAADITHVAFSDPALITVAQLDSDWMLTSLAAFDTTEILTVEFSDGSVIEIQVTDEQYMGKPDSYHVYRLFEDRSDFNIEYNSTTKIGGSSYIYFYYCSSASTSAEVDDDAGSHYWSWTSGDGMAQATTWSSPNNSLWFYIFDDDKVYFNEENRRAYQMGKSALIGRAELYFTSYPTTISWTKASGATIDPESLCSVQVESRVCRETDTRNVEVYYNGIKAGEAKNVLFPNKNDYSDGYDQRNGLVVNQKNTSRYSAQNYTLTYEDPSDTQTVAYTYDSNTKTYRIYFYDYAYKLTYDLNGGTIDGADAVADQVYGIPTPTSSSSYTFTINSTEPRKAGYKFSHWSVTNTVSSSTADTGNKAAGGTIKLNGINSSNGSTQTAHVTLTAQWTAIPDVIIHHYLKGTTTPISADTTVKLPYGDTVDVSQYALSDPTCIVDSYLPSSFEVGTTADGNTAIIYYNYKTADYTVEVYRQNIDGATYNKTTEIKNGVIGSTVSVSSSAYDSAGFTFDENNASNVLSGTVTSGGLTLRLYYTRNSYTVTTEKGTGIGSVSGSGTYMFGETVSISATVKSGYTFNGWYDGNNEKISSDMEYTFTLGPDDVKLTAKASANTDTKYTVNHIYKDYGSDKDRVISEIKTGATDTLTKAEKQDAPGYTADNVKQVNINGDGSSVINITYIEIPVSYTYISGNTKYGTVDPEGETIGAFTGTPGTVKPTANNGFRFEGWYTNPECTEKTIEGVTVSESGELTPVRQNGLYTGGSYYAGFAPVESSVTVVMHVRGDYADLTLPFTGKLSYTVCPGSPSAEGTMSYSLSDSEVSEKLTVNAGESFSFNKMMLPDGYELEKIVYGGTEVPGSDAKGHVFEFISGDNEVHVYYKCRNNSDDVIPTGINAGSNGSVAAVFTVLAVMLLVLAAVRRRRRYDV